MDCDVLIAGGGPAGSTLGCLLRKYNPCLDVTIVERERFPRDHVGESQLPAVCAILDEMGVWDKVEAAGFPVKIGSTYRWGSTDELWNVNFLLQEYSQSERPGRYEGQRAQTAFQVDRSLYDKILLDHARDLGCKVFEGTKVLQVETDGDRVNGLTVQGDLNTTIQARHYVDASGAGGLFRRAFQIPVNSPTHLRNLAFWDYWQDAEWAETIGNGGTRVQVMSLGWGWIWFIPITESRTSVGLVVPAEYYKASGKKPEELYREALAQEPRINVLLESATCESKFETTKDWNFVSDRLAGENWLMVGDACGFADPILAAGMTLAQVSGRKAAYTILEIDRGEVPREWLVAEYGKRHRTSIQNHINFAEFWYSANGCFTDLREHCAEIARSAGIDLDPEAAFQWLGSGGFAGDLISEERTTAFGFLSAKGVVGRFTNSIAEWEVAKNNRFRPNLRGCQLEPFAMYFNGRVMAAKSYRRGNKLLPMVHRNRWILELLQLEDDASQLAKMIWRHAAQSPQEFSHPESGYRVALEVLEALISDGWVIADIDPTRPFLKLQADTAEQPPSEPVSAH